MDNDAVTFGKIAKSPLGCNYMMRNIAPVKTSNSNTVRLMICDKGIDGVFVFGYHTEEDSCCSWDCHFNELEDAYKMGVEYGIQKSDWVEISDPFEHCQDDWIKPVRLLGRIDGNPQWGKFEQLIDGQWTRINSPLL